MLGNIHDKAVVESILKGNSREMLGTMELLYEHHFSLIKQYVLNNRGSEKEAEDLFQEALIVFFLNVKKGSFQAESSIRTYLFAIAKRLWLKQLQKAKAHMDVVELESSISIEQDLKLLDRHLSIKSFLDKLDVNCRSVLIDFYYHKSPIRVLVNKYGLGSEGAMKNKKYRCLQKLIKMVKDRNLGHSDFNHE